MRRLQPKVKESLASDKHFLKQLINSLAEAPAKSPLTYGALSILVNLTAYVPALSEEQKRMTQLKAYANATKSPIKPDPLNDDDHVAKRCEDVFQAGVIPILVTHSQHGSTASLALVVSIVFSLSKTSKIRGQMGTTRSGQTTPARIFYISPRERYSTKNDSSCTGSGSHQYQSHTRLRWLNASSSDIRYTTSSLPSCRRSNR